MNRDVGFAYPFEFRRGRVRTVGGTQLRQTNEDRCEAVSAGVNQVLLTSKGGRVMLCSFGAGLDRFCFQPIQGLESFAPIEAKEAVQTWCTRATVNSATAIVAPGLGAVAVSLDVRHNDADRDTIVNALIRTR